MNLPRISACWRPDGPFAGLRGCALGLIVALSGLIFVPTAERFNATYARAANESPAEQKPGSENREELESEFVSEVNAEASRRHVPRRVTSIRPANALRSPAAFSRMLGSILPHCGAFLTPLRC